MTGDPARGGRCRGGMVDLTGGVGRWELGSQSWDL